MKVLRLPRPSSRAEVASRETEERYRELFDHANDVIFTTDLRGNLTSLNKAGEAVTGYTAEEADKQRWQNAALALGAFEELAESNSRN
jgi:PAS domain S-box-containing protein